MVLNKELTDFLARQCKDKKLSFRSLSVNAGLSPGTVHNIVNGKYRPNLSSLNALADYLGVKREYLWDMAGLLEDMDYGSETVFNDSRLRFYFAQVDKLPKAKRDIILGVLKALIGHLKPVHIPAKEAKLNDDARGKANIESEMYIGTDSERSEVYMSTEVEKEELLKAPLRDKPYRPKEFKN